MQTTPPAVAVCSKHSVTPNPCARPCRVSNDQRAQPEHLLTHSAHNAPRSNNKVNHAGRVQCATLLQARGSSYRMTGKFWWEDSLANAECVFWLNVLRVELVLAIMIFIGKWLIECAGNLTRP